MKAFLIAPCAALALLAAPAEAQSLGNILNSVLGTGTNQNYNGYNNTQYGYTQQPYAYQQSYGYQQPYAGQQTYRYGRRYSRRYAQQRYGSYGARSNYGYSDRQYERYSRENGDEGRRHHGYRNSERRDHGEGDNSRDD